jgi:HD-GYP domain-containing protein (c-di-GMP phosphodiesterase class II)
MRHLAHTEDAAALLANKAHVSPRILMLIRDHEELGNGEGFPSKKKFDALPPIQQVLNICNHYDRACERAQTSPIEAGKKFFIEKIGLFKLDVLTALSEVVGRPG